MEDGRRVDDWSTAVPHALLQGLVVLGTSALWLLFASDLRRPAFWLVAAGWGAGVILFLRFRRNPFPVILGDGTVDSDEMLDVAKIAFRATLARAGVVGVLFLATLDPQFGGAHWHRTAPIGVLVVLAAVVAFSRAAGDATKLRLQLLRSPLNDVRVRPTRLSPVWCSYTILLLLLALCAHILLPDFWVAVALASVIATQSSLSYAGAALKVGFGPVWVGLMAVILVGLTCLQAWRFLSAL